MPRTGVLPVLVSTLVLVVAAGALPPAAAWALVGSLVVLTAGLWVGIGEPVACRLMTGASPATEVERSVLAPAVALACQAGLGPPVVELRVHRRGCGLLASPFGHRTVLVPRELVECVQQGIVTSPAAAASLCHAAAVTRAGLTSRGPAFTLWCLPWLLLRMCATAAARVALIRLAWRARLLVFTVTVAQLLSAHHTGLGLGVAALAGVTYLQPALSRAQARHVTMVGDLAVTENGLGREYLQLLATSGTQVSLERRARLMDARPRTPATDAQVLPLTRAR